MNVNSLDSSLEHPMGMASQIHPSISSNQAKNYPGTTIGSSAFPSTPNMLSARGNGDSLNGKK